MKPLTIAATFVISVAAIMLFNRKETVEEPLEPQKEPLRDVSTEELRRVMSHLGKKSGEARSNKVD